MIESRSRTRQGYRRIRCERSPQPVMLGGLVSTSRVLRSTGLLRFHSSDLGNHTQMAPPVAPAHGGGLSVVVVLVRKLVARARRLAHRISQRFEIVATGLERFRIGGDAHDLPATWRGEPVGMHLTQVVTVRFGVG